MFLLALSWVCSANCAKTDFLSRMSHALRTPLNAIGAHGYLTKPVNDSELLNVRDTRFGDLASPNHT